MYNRPLPLNGIPLHLYYIPLPYMAVLHQYHRRPLVNPLMPLLMSLTRTGSLVASYMYVRAPLSLQIESLLVSFIAYALLSSTGNGLPYWAGNSTQKLLTSMPAY